MNRGIIYFPESVKSEQVFNAIGATGTGTVAKNWQQWQKPKGCQFVAIFALGAGAGGGNGHSAAASNARGGGGGGGSGAFVKAIFLASMLPDTLWIQVPRGGDATQAGGRAFICLTRSPSSFVTADIILCSGAADAGAGGNGTGAAAGLAGTASTVPINTTGGAGALCIAFEGQAGINGSAGGAIAGGNGAANAPSIIVSGGGGGGGTTSADFAGGNVTGIGSNQFAVPTITGGAAGSNAGAHGLSFFGGAFIHRGGAGGGASNTGVGGAGGNGGLGSGGGGGGGGTTGGTGGRGGDGIVIISTW